MGGARRTVLAGRAELEASPRLRVIRLLAETSRPWTFALVAFVVVSAVMPVAVLVAMGQVVGRVPAAARSGLRSAAGHGLITALVVSIVAYALTLVLGPVQGTISSAVKVRLTYAMQDRLVAAVRARRGSRTSRTRTRSTSWSWPAASSAPTTPRTLPSPWRSWSATASAE